jgi:hypothetical protein
LIGGIVQCARGTRTQNLLRRFLVRIFRL